MMPEKPTASSLRGKPKEKDDSLVIGRHSARKRFKLLFIRRLPV